MKLSGLIPLYRSMKQQDIGRYKFHYELNHLTFDCLFFIDIEPFELVMGCLGHNFAVFNEIKQGFEISPFIEPKSTFFDLLNALKTTDASFNRFDPVDFFKQFNEKIPEHANPRNIVKPSDVVRYYSDIEESDKIHFCGWLDNNIRKNKVSDSNLEKTRHLMGQQVYEFAKRRNQSTKWTHDQSMAVDLYLPD